MRRLVVPTLSGFVLSVLVAGGAGAHRADQPPHQRHAMGDLKLESGEVIRDFAISYVTHGTLNAKRSNAILMVTALTGNHRSEEHTSELQSQSNLVCRLLLEKKKQQKRHLQHLYTISSQEHS